MELSPTSSVLQLFKADPALLGTDMQFITSIDENRVYIILETRENIELLLKILNRGLSTMSPEKPGVSGMFQLRDCLRARLPEPEQLTLPTYEELIARPSLVEPIPEAQPLPEET